MASVSLCTRPYCLLRLAWRDLGLAGRVLPPTGGRVRQELEVWLKDSLARCKVPMCLGPGRDQNAQPDPEISLCPSCPN